MTFVASASLIGSISAVLTGLVYKILVKRAWKYIFYGWAFGLGINLLPLLIFSGTTEVLDSTWGLLPFIFLFTSMGTFLACLLSEGYRNFLPKVRTSLFKNHQKT